MQNKRPFIPVRPQKSCGKNYYESRTEADAVAREQEIIFATNNLKLRSYRCAVCGGWHLTRVSKSDTHHI